MNEYRKNPKSDPEKQHTVNLRSKGHVRKGKSPLGDIDFSSNKIFLVIPILAIKEFQSMGKIGTVP